VGRLEDKSTGIVVIKKQTVAHWKIRKKTDSNYSYWIHMTRVRIGNYTLIQS
jgi:hypothetical protein